MVIFSRLRHLIVLVLAVGIGSTVGYMAIEGWPFLDSFYMTVITLGTIGFEEVRPLSPAGQIWTIFVVATGVGTIAYTFTSATRIIVEGEVRNLFRRRKMEKKIDAMNGHYILCGYGRMGRLVCREFQNAGIDFVVIDDDPAVVEEIVKEGIPVVQGDAAGDAVLQKAGVERAKGLICAVDTDAENVYITLTARELNNNLQIVARAVEEDAEDKLRKAGADRVVSPYQIGGLRIAQALLRPAVVDFIELAVKGGSFDLQMEQVKLEGGSELTEQTLAQSNIRGEFNIIVVAIQRDDGGILYNPASQAVLHEKDCLIVLGPPENLKKFQRKAQGGG